VVNYCTKGSLTSMTEVAKIAILKVMSSSQVGWILFRYWWLGTLVL